MEGGSIGEFIFKCKSFVKMMLIIKQMESNFKKKQKGSSYGILRKLNFECNE